MPREAMLIVARPPYMELRVSVRSNRDSLGARKGRGRRRSPSGSNSSASAGPESRGEGNASVFTAQGHTTGS